jgi:hypothetical protein
MPPPPGHSRAPLPRTSPSVLSWAVCAHCACSHRVHSPQMIGGPPWRPVDGEGVQDDRETRCCPGSFLALPLTTQPVACVCFACALPPSGDRDQADGRRPCSCSSAACPYRPCGLRHGECVARALPAFFETSRPRQASRSPISAHTLPQSLTPRTPPRPPAYVVMGLVAPLARVRTMALRGAVAWAGGASVCTRSAGSSSLSGPPYPTFPACPPPPPPSYCRPQEDSLCAVFIAALFGHCSWLPALAARGACLDRRAVRWLLLVKQFRESRHYS